MRNFAAMTQLKKNNKGPVQTLVWWLAIAAAAVVVGGIVYIAMTLPTGRFRYDNLVSYVAEERARLKAERVVTGPARVFDLTAPSAATTADSAMLAIAADSCRAAVISTFDDATPAVVRRCLLSWLTERGSVWMLRWKENGRDVFAAVFDSDVPRLVPEVYKRLADEKHVVPEEYVIPGRRFPYPIARRTPEGFVSVPADAGVPAVFVQMTKPWEMLVKGNDQIVSSFQRTPLKHFLSGVYVDFSAQSAFDISSVSGVTFNVDRAVARARVRNQPRIVEHIFTAAAVPADTCFLGSCAWYELSVDPSWTFHGDMPYGTARNDLIRTDIAIADASPLPARAREFFAAAPALATAVANVIADPDVRPDGDIVLSAFILGME